MTFPSFEGSQPDLYQHVRWALQIASSIKRSATSLRDRSEVEDVNADAILTFHQDLKLQRDDLDTIRNLSGIGPVAQEIIGDPGLNLGAEYTALETVINNTLSWVETNIPNSGSPNFWLQDRNFQSQVLTSRTFTPAQTAGLRTELDLLIAQID